MSLKSESISFADRRANVILHFQNIGPIAQKIPYKELFFGLALLDSKGKQIGGGLSSISSPDLVLENRSTIYPFYVSLPSVQVGSKYYLLIKIRNLAGMVELTVTQ